MIEVGCNIFAEGDHEKLLGTIKAWTPIAREEMTMSGLQPSTRYLRLALLGSFFSMLSQPFLGHLTLLRPSSPSNPFFSLANFSSLFYTTLLIPPFVVVYFPAWVRGKLGLGARKSGGGWKRDWMGRVMWGVCNPSLAFSGKQVPLLPQTKIDPQSGVQDI